MGKQVTLHNTITGRERTFPPRTAAVYLSNPDSGWQEGPAPKRGGGSAKTPSQEG